MATKRGSKHRPESAKGPKGLVKDLEAKGDAGKVKGGIPPKTTSSNGGGDLS